MRLIFIKIGRVSHFRLEIIFFQNNKVKQLISIDASKPFIVNCLFYPFSANMVLLL